MTRRPEEPGRGSSWAWPLRSCEEERPVPLGHAYQALRLESRSLGLPTVWPAGPPQTAGIGGLAVWRTCGCGMEHRILVLPGALKMHRRDRLTFTLEQWFSKWSPWTNNTHFT